MGIRLRAAKSGKSYELTVVVKGKEIKLYCPKSNVNELVAGSREFVYFNPPAWDAQKKGVKGK